MTANGKINSIFIGHQDPVAHHNLMLTVFLTKLENVADKFEQAQGADGRDREFNIVTMAKTIEVSTPRAAAWVCWNL